MEQATITGIQSERAVAVAEVKRKASDYRYDFLKWLESDAGFAIMRRFVEEADKLRARGRQHYSARTIFEVIRHETALREDGGEVKINNNNAPDAARLYMALRGCPGFFELRGR